MLFDILTIFPEFFDSALGAGVIRRALEEEILTVRAVDLREFTDDRHRTTDDRPFGGGEGMVMKPEPIFKALEALGETPPEPMVVLLSPRGKVFDQGLARDLVKVPRIALICGRYEGIDERIREHCVDLELSIGDYVLSGGEVAALVVVDALSRLLPGVLGCDTSAVNDSFSTGLLEHPQYTRPRSFMGWDVPDILVSGDHKKIERWRREQSLRQTLENRPDLLEHAELFAKDRRFLEALGWRG